MEIFTSALLSLSFLVTSQLGFTLSAIPQIEPQSYSKFDQHTLVDPSVVRILHQIKGDLIMKNFTFDEKTGEIIPDPDNNELVGVPIDQLISGTGFAISEDGIFITNAHVASKDLFMDEFVENIYDSMAYYVNSHMIFGNITNIPEKERSEFTAMAKRFTGDDVERYRNEDLAALRKLLTFKSDESKIVILEQGVKFGDTEDALTVGKEVSILAIEKNWTKTQRDVALLQIKGVNPNIPAVALATSTQLSVYTPIDVYGFPGATDLSTSTATNITVTHGDITSIKQVANSDMETYQIDAKISQGNSGGPMITNNGKAAGIVTFETGSYYGDNFGFALPISIIYNLLEESGITNLTTEYQVHIREALGFKNEKRCEQALKSFSKALELVENNKYSQNRIHTSIAECKSIIEQGNSIDSKLDEIRHYLLSFGIATILLLGGGLILLYVVLTGGLMTFRQFIRNRKRLENLEEKIEEQGGKIQHNTESIESEYNSDSD